MTTICQPIESAQIILAAELRTILTSPEALDLAENACIRLHAAGLICPHPEHHREATRLRDRISEMAA